MNALIYKCFEAIFIGVSRLICCDPQGEPLCQREDEPSQSSFTSCHALAEAPPSPTWVLWIAMIRRQGPVTSQMHAVTPGEISAPKSRPKLVASPAIIVAAFWIVQFV